MANTTLTQVGISVGTERAGAAVLLNSSPFFGAVVAPFVLAEPITRLQTAGLVIGFGGVLLVVFSDPGSIAHGSRLASGFLLALLGALGWAGGGLGMRVLILVAAGLGFGDREVEQLRPESSVGKCPLVLMTLRIWRCNASIELVV